VSKSPTTLRRATWRTLETSRFPDVTRAGRCDLAAAPLYSLGGVYWRLRRANEARDAYGRAMVIYEDLGRIHDKVDCLDCLAYALSSCKDPECFPLLQKARLLYIELGDKKFAAKCVFKEALWRTIFKCATQQERLELHYKSRVEFYELGDLCSAFRALMFEGLAYECLNNRLAALWSYRSAAHGLRERGNKTTHYQWVAETVLGVC